MSTNRRNWIKQVGLGVAGLGTSSLNSFAKSPAVLTPGSNNNDPIKLNSNENPYGVSPSARMAMADKIGISNRYDWELTSKLVSKIAVKNDVKEENVIMGAGSTEIIDFVVGHAAKNKGNFIVSEPTFSYWGETAKSFGLNKISIPLTTDKKYNLSGILKSITPDTRLVYICNPNNPTGTTCGQSELIHFIELATKKTLVLVDEAYIDYSDQKSLSSLVLDNENLIIAKTFSKIHGLAGARAGYGIANKSTIENLGTLQTWINGSISVVSTAGALASMQDEKYTKECMLLNEKVKQFTVDQLKKRDIKFIPSQANFIYFSLLNYKKDFFAQLKDNDILGTRIYEEDGSWTRITFGTMYEMERLFQII